MTFVVGLVNDTRIARKVKAELIEAGCPETELTVCSLEDGNGEIATTVETALQESKFDEDEVRSYADQVRSGKVLVTAHIPDEISDKAVEVIERYEGSGGEEQDENNEREVSRTAPVVEEELKVGKQQKAGTVRAQRVVTEQPVEETVGLREETVDVERRAADRELTDKEKEEAFTETSIELPETKEEAVVSKQARVVGEVGLHKEAKERQQKIKDKVRRADVEVKRDAKKPDKN